ELGEHGVLVFRSIVHPYVSGDCRLMMFSPFIFTALLIMIDHLGAIPAALHILGRDRPNLIDSASAFRHLIELRLRACWILTMGHIIHPRGAKDYLLII